METGAEAVLIEVVSAVVVAIEGASEEGGEVTGEDLDPARWTQVKLLMIHTLAHLKMFSRKLIFSIQYSPVKNVSLSVLCVFQG